MGVATTMMTTNVITKEMHETVVANNPDLAVYDHGFGTTSSDTSSYNFEAANGDKEHGSVMFLQMLRK